MWTFPPCLTRIFQQDPSHSVFRSAIVGIYPFKDFVQSHTIKEFTDDIVTVLMGAEHYFLRFDKAKHFHEIVVTDLD